MFAKTLVCLTLLLAPLAAVGAPPASTVELKNAESWTVLVGLGTREGVRADADFEVVGADGGAAALLYPAELAADHFWSQPLSPDAFERVRTGMAVRSAALDRPAHDRLRREGQARRAAVAQEKAEERRREVLAQLGELREQRRSLLRRREAQEERIASRERDLIGAEARSGRAGLSEEGDVDRSLEAMGNLSDQRNELQSRRDALVEQDPYPKEDVNRLSSDIERLNDRMESERRRIRIANDRRRSAEGAYLSAREEWRRLLADLDQLDREIAALTDRIRDLEAEISDKR